MLLTNLFEKLQVTNEYTILRVPDLTLGVDLLAPKSYLEHLSSNSIYPLVLVLALGLYRWTSLHYRP